MTHTPDSTAIAPADDQKAIFIVPARGVSKGAGTQIEVRIASEIASETVWLTPAQMATLMLAGN